MKTFTVHEPPNPPSDRSDRGEQLMFVKDGFCWRAALATPFWLLSNRLWLPLLGYIAAVLAIGGGLSALGAPAVWSVLIASAFQLLVGFEASSLRRWGFERRGWNMLGSVVGRSISECERRFYEAWLPTQPAIASPGSARPHDGNGGDAPRSPNVLQRDGWRRLIGQS